MRAWLAMLAIGCVAPSDDGGRVDPSETGADTGETAPVDTGDSAATSDFPPNLLVVILDDVGIDRTPWDADSLTAPDLPTLSALADDGVRFTNAWAHPSCSPSRASILTGQHAFRHGIGQYIAPLESAGGLDDDLVTISDVLHDAPIPYTTALVGKWHLTGFATEDDPRTHPKRLGFDHVRGTLANPLDWYGEPPMKERSYRFWQDVQDGVDAPREGWLTHDTIDDAVAMVETLPEPWLLVVSLHAAHSPWAPPPGDRTPWWALKDVYDAILEDADTSLARLVGAVDRDTTQLVVTSDNGTPSQVTRPPLTRGQAKGTVWEGGLKVPLVVTGPLAARDAQIDTPVMLLDLFATLAAWGGTEAPASDGTSWAAWTADPRQAPDDRIVYSEKFDADDGFAPDEDHRWAARNLRFKLMEEPLGTEQLLDLTAGFDGGGNLLDGDLDDEASAALTALRAHAEAMRP